MSTEKTTDINEGQLQFIVNRKAFSDALATLAPAISKRSTLPILENVCITVCDVAGIELVATNLEIRTSVTIPYEESEISHIGMVTVNYKELTNIVKSVKDDTLLIYCSQDNSLVIKSDSTSVTLETLPGEEFPVAPMPQEKNRIEAQTVTLPIETLRTMVNLVSYAASDGKDYNTGIVLTSIKVSLHDDTLSFVAGDKFRLAIAKETIQESDSWDIDLLIPATSLIAACKQLPKGTKKNPNPGYVTITAVCSDFVTITSNQYCLYSRLIAQDRYSKYPEIERYVPQESDVIAEVQISAFKTALETIEKIAKECSNNKTQLHVNGALDVMAKKLGMKEPATAHVPAITTDTEGETTDIFIDWLYLMDTVKAHPQGSMNIELTGTLKPLKFTYSDTPGFVGVIMPLHPERT